MTKGTAGAGGDLFTGRSVLIFGGAKGIGRAIALEFARRGARVGVADIDVGESKRTAEDIVTAGGEAIGLECNVLSDASILSAADQVTEAIAAPDIVVNNVGAIISGNPEDIPIAEWERLLSLNLMSVVRSNAVFLPRFLARRSGYIVNTASFAGLYPYATNRMPYVAAKAAVIALSESLALYLHPQGIRISCLCPGPVATGIMEGIRSWTPDLPMRGCGSQFTLHTPDMVAKTLADAMVEGRVIIPSHPEVWDTIREHAASPDAFIAQSIARFAAGDNGAPRIDPAMLAALRGTQNG